MPRERQRGGGAAPAAAAPRRRRARPTAILISTADGAAVAAVRSARGTVQGLDKDGKRVTYASLEEAKAKATKIFARNYNARHGNPT